MCTLVLCRVSTERQVSASEGSLLFPSFCALVKFVLRLIVIMTVLSQCSATTTNSSQQYLSFFDNHLDDESHVTEIERTVEPQVLARLESKYLNLFGLERIPPRRVKPLRVPKYLIDLYNSQGDTPFSTTDLNVPGRHTKTANTIRTFYHQASDSPAEWGHQIRFDLSGIPKTETVTGAELRLFFNLKNTESIIEESGLALESCDSVQVIVNDVMRPGGKKGRREPIMYPIDSKFVNLRKRRQSGTTEFWLTFDVLPAVSRWIEIGKAGKYKNHGLIIQMVHPSGQILTQSTVHHVRVTRDTDSSSSSSPSESDPVLFAYSDDGANKKLGRGSQDALWTGHGNNRKKEAERPNKRAKNRERDKENEPNRLENRSRKLCGRYKMRVNFDDVGWDAWVVAPTHYQAYHCVGRCKYPLASNMNSTHHSVIQAMVNDLNPQQVPPPCCVPTKYSPQRMIYHDHEGNVAFKVFDNMVVEECGCR